MKSMVCNYASVEREIKAYEVSTKLEGDKTSGSIGKRYVRQALDHFELHHNDHNYHFLIHEPLGFSVQFLLNNSGGHLYIPFVKDLASQMLHALEFIHSAQVIHAGLTSSDTLHSVIHM